MFPFRSLLANLPEAKHPASHRLHLQAAAKLLAKHHRLPHPAALRSPIDSGYAVGYRCLVCLTHSLFSPEPSRSVRFVATRRVPICSSASCPSSVSSARSLRTSVLISASKAQAFWPFRKPVRPSSWVFSKTVTWPQYMLSAVRNSLALFVLTTHPRCFVCVQ